MSIVLSLMPYYNEHEADVETMLFLRNKAIYNMNLRESLRKRFKHIKIVKLSSLYIYKNIMHVRQNIQIFKIIKTDIFKY